KSKSLIEGRKPNYHISASVAVKTDEKEQYIRNRGFKDEHYKKMILQYIEKFGHATKGDIDSLVYDTLPNILSDKQKHNKIHNILYAMSKKEMSIKNKGTNRTPKWIKA